MLNKLWILFLIGMAFTGLIIGWVHQARANAGNDAERLVNVTKPLLENDLKLTFKYMGVAKVCSKQANLLSIGTSLSKELELPQAAGLDPANDRLYTTELKGSEQDAITLKLMWMEASSNCYMVLKRETTVSPRGDSLLSWQKQTSAMLNKLGIAGEWNVMLQGMASDDAAEPTELMNTLVANLRGEVLETYRDQGTLSYSLFSEDFDAGIHSRDQRLNLQVAVHRDSESGGLKVTVGTPIITGEY